MSKKLILTVELEFADKIYSDDDISEIMEHTVYALREQANSGCLAPTDGDTYTTNIKVSHENGEVQTHKFI